MEHIPLVKLRLDLLEYLTAEDIMEAALASVHRDDPEPNFAKTGIGSLKPATQEERMQEETRQTALVERLKKRKLEAEIKTRDCPPVNEPAEPTG
jgi:hypothetical protein